MRRSFTPVVLAAAAYVLLTIALTWPLALHPRTIVPNDPGDPLLNTWILSWNARTLPLTDRWWNAPQFHPLEGATAYTEHLLGLAPMTSPIIWLTGDHLLAYNVAFFLSFVFCGLSAHYLAFVITRRHDVAFVAGLAFAFAPYRMTHLAHIQVLSSYWMPLCLAGLHQYLQARERRARWLVLFAGAWLMQALACGYYLFFLPVLVGLWVLWFALRRERLGDVLRISSAFAAATVALTPVLYGYWRISRTYNLRRGREEIESFSADIASILKAPVEVLSWRWLEVFSRSESELFPGLTVLLVSIVALVLAWRAAAHGAERYPKVARILTAVGVTFLAIFAARLIYGPYRLEILGLKLLSVTVPHKPLSVAVLCLVAVALMHPAVRLAWRNRSPLAFYALAAMAMWLMALGPAPTLMGNPALYKAPYAWLMMLPGVDGIRVPARFWMLAVLCLAACAAVALHYLGTRWPAARRTLVILACVGVLIDGWPVVMRHAQRPTERPNYARAAMRLDLPLGRADTIALYRAASHHRPLVNGYSGYFAAHYWAVESLVLDADPTVLSLLAEYGPIEVMVDHDRDGDGRLRRMVSGYAGTELVHWEKDYSSYRVPPRPERTKELSGPEVPVASAASPINPESIALMFDGDPITRWHAARPQAPGDWMRVDLGEARSIRGVRMFLGGYSADFPRRLVVESSIDGVTWNQVWSGAGGGPALAGALLNPQWVPVDIPFAEHQARFLRFTQHGSDPVIYWSIAELKVLGR
jgi:hypothetical protein